MKFRTALLILMLVALAVFALVNWTAVMAPTSLSLGFTEFRAPLGLLLLMVTVGVSALFLIYIVFQQAGVIMETRRYAKELKTHRELADKAEASRFTELRVFLEGELRRLEAQGAASTRELAARLDQLHQGLQREGPR